MNKNSMFYWYPLVKDLPIPQPKTSLIPFEGDFTYAICDGKITDDWRVFVDRLKREGKRIGYPLFMRSDEVSAKFDWKRSCYVESEDRILGNLVTIVEFTAMAFTVGFSGIALREFLELDTRFTAFWGEMPVAAEWRWFVRDGAVECFHPYWPPSSIKKPSIPEWRNVLKTLQEASMDERQRMESYVQLIGRTLGGYWSVDLCRHKNKTIYLTDMALGDDSYHWATCPHAPPSMLAQYGDPDSETDEE